MSQLLSEEMKSDFLRRGFSRRSLGRVAALLAGGSLPFFNESALAQLSYIGKLDSEAVKINANENPLGPCPEAAEAIHGVVQKGGRYMYGETFKMAQVLAAQEGLKREYVLPFAGSSDPLHRVVLAYTSPQKSFVVADPGYEAGARAAKFVGAKVVKVPLKKDYSHDVKAMAAADANAGVIYICNPNNPTGTVTKRADIEWLVANKPAGSVILLDEAYIHFTSEPFSSDFVAKDKDVVVLRTFSKLYGMAGLRAGAALGRPDLLERIRHYGAGALPVTAMVGATASLESKTVVQERSRIVAETRDDVLDWLAKHNFDYIPSISNKFMVDVKRPGGEVVKAMAAKKVYIGRVWPVWPTFVRVSIGTPAEMAKFKKAFLEVMA